MRAVDDEVGRRDARSEDGAAARDHVAKRERVVHGHRRRVGLRLGTPSLRAITRGEIESRATVGALRERRSEDEAPYFAATFDGTESDASLLLLEQLGFVKADDPRYIETVDAVERDLRRGDYLFRYAVADDFGVPQTAFNICTFWFIDAIAAIGRKDEAAS